MVPLKLEGIRKTYGDHVAVDNMNLEVSRGEIFGLLGGNGAGKTTTMRMVLGIIMPDGGTIKWNGAGYSNELTKIMGYLPEERGLYPKLKVKDQIVYLGKLRGMTANEADRKLKEWLDRFGVPEYYDKKIEELSKGNQQKMQFIAAVIHNPQILVLDEAFSGLDPVNVELLKSTVKELRDNGTTILFSTHRMEHVEELCENICIMHRSKTVLKGSIKEIKGKFPKEKALLKTSGKVTGLDTLNGVKVAERIDDYTIQLTFDSNAAAQSILTHAIQQTEVQRFEILEPTLNEIFIRSVGENIE